MDSNKSLVFLIGMPGTGKTYWAEHLSEAFGFQMLDIDDEIEEEEDMSITDIFDKRGEEWFREKEKQILNDIIRDNKEGSADENAKVIIACGGGTPCFFDNMQRMREAGTVIYLRSKPETIIERILHEVEKRPLLAEQTELIEYAQELLDTRKETYEQAHHILDTENISLTTFEQILK